MNNLNTSNGDDGDHELHDPHFEPIIYLPEIVVNTFEEDETTLIKERAKLFRHDSEEQEWKERGTGDVKLLHNEKTHTVRVLMRREKTYKLCANHYVTKDMELKPNCGSDRAWVWTTQADVSDGEPRTEVLAIKFQNSAAADRWKVAFEKSKDLIQECTRTASDDESESSSEYSQSEDSQDSQDEEIIRHVKEMSLKNEKAKEKIAEKDSESEIKIEK